ncbi:hypothetical protein [Lactiplantibacillus plajomi]|uniref:Capsular polysaccharide biosynthesis protein CpsC n=2 Tax=Lactiplantibacillus plajomi TaxID=1457217 RepID=A0ABV6K2R2_9LACO|nr:hypothetical protein [Lactiplantibacillus plajomi]
MDSIYEVNGKAITRFFKRYLVVIIITGAIFAFIGMGISLITPGIKYSANSALVQNDNNYVVVRLFPNYVKSSSFEKQVKKAVGESKWRNQTYGEDYQVSASTASSTTTQVTLTVVSSKKAFSKYLITTVTKAFARNVKKSLPRANVSIMNINSKPVVFHLKVQLFKVGLIGFLLGALGAALFLLRKMVFVGAVEDNRYISDVYGIPELGSMDVETNRVK